MLVGPNGAGKTNLLEAVSLLAAGTGLRRSAYAELARTQGDQSWAVSARVHSRVGLVDIGTGMLPGAQVSSRQTGRTVRINNETVGSGALADYIHMAWVTPSMDGLFTGSGSDRRRFLDRLILNFDASYRGSAAAYERAMTNRNRLLSDNVREAAMFAGFERVMAESGVAIAAARLAVIAAVRDVIEQRKARDPDSPFPWAGIELEGTLEAELQSRAAVDVEDAFVERLARFREKDRAAGRTLEGPHRTDLLVTHGPKNMPAKVCSTGEQKSLLLGLILAQAGMLAVRYDGQAPILLLDEITAHLDLNRRAALFAELSRLGAQAWMTGTDQSAFQPLEGRGEFYRVEDGKALPI